MGLFSGIFTWWNGATFGTWLNTRATGKRVGEDDLGNVYYEAEKLGPVGNRRRWVMYSGANDSSLVPAEWHGWLHNTLDEVPEKALPPRRAFEKPSSVNLTGTILAWRPAGALGSGERRAAATGDYEAWTPDA